MAQNDKKRITIPALGVKRHEPTKKTLLKALPIIMITPDVHDKLMKPVSKETEKLKKMIGDSRDPEYNNTGINLKAFVAGITDAKKISGIKNPKTGQGIPVFIFETEYGKYVLSRVELKELRDLHSAFLDLDCETNRKMVVPLHEGKGKLYIEKMEEKLELEIDVDYSGIETELSKTILYHMNIPETEKIIYEMEKKRDTSVNAKIDNIQLMEDALFDLVYLAVKTTSGDEYWIFVKEDRSTDIVFAVPEMPGMVEIDTGDRKYAVVTFFSNEPIDTSEFSIN